MSAASWQNFANTIIIDDFETVPSCHKKLLCDWYAPLGWKIFFASDLGLIVPDGSPSVGTTAKRIHSRYWVLTSGKKVGKTFYVDAHVFPLRDPLWIAERLNESVEEAVSGLVLAPFTETLLLSAYGMIDHARWGGSEDHAALSERTLREISGWRPTGALVLGGEWLPRPPRKSSELIFASAWKYGERPWLNVASASRKLWLTGLMELVVAGKVSVEDVKADYEAQLVGPSVYESVLQPEAETFSKTVYDLDRLTLYPGRSPTFEQTRRIHSKEIQRRLDSGRVTIERYVRSKWKNRSFAGRAIDRVVGRLPKPFEVKASALIASLRAAARSQSKR